MYETDELRSYGLYIVLDNDNFKTIIAKAEKDKQVAFRYNGEEKCYSLEEFVKLLKFGE